MAKYQEVHAGKDKSGKTVHLTRLLSDTPKRILTVYEPVAYERLDNIAYKFYGDPKYWYLIAQTNNIADGRFHVPEGMTLLIPEL